MAHKVYEVEIGQRCPRCGNTQARLAIYHFGNTYTAECAGCGWGMVDGANEAQATARYRGKLLESERVSFLRVHAGQGDRQA